MPALRTIFFGTAEIACPILEALCAADFINLVLVVTQPDRPSGRQLRLHPSPVKRDALRLERPVAQPERARDPNFVKELAELMPDLIVVVAYGQILRASVLGLPRLGCVNVHMSLLPKHRGAAPIQWAMLQDERETGVTIMRMDEGLDTGPVLTQSSTPIIDEDTAESLQTRLGKLGAELLLKTIPDFASGVLVPRPQAEENSSYARKITKKDGQIQWDGPARGIWNAVRSLSPWPGAYTFMPVGSAPCLLKIWRSEILDNVRGQAGEVIAVGADGIVVACGERALRVLELQREGGRRLSPRDFLAGNALPTGTKLG